MYPSSWHRARTLLAHKPGPQPLLSSVFPRARLWTPSTSAPHPDTWEGGREEGGREGWGGWGGDRAAEGLRPGKKEEEIETESQPAEQDPRHKGLG